MNTAPPINGSAPVDRAKFIRDRLPSGGLFADHGWRISPEPFSLGDDLAGELETLGRVLLQFNRAANLLYRQSISGEQPTWVAELLDQGKPRELVAIQRSAALKNALPRVIRPDLLWTADGVRITELDSVPGGIGLTGWLNQTYAQTGATVLGGPDGVMRGFAAIFGDAPATHIVVSEEAATYRPEMEWLCSQMEPGRFHVRDTNYLGFKPGEAVYRFFELFDLPNVSNSGRLFELAQEQQIHLTPPPKPLFEEKMLFGLLWNRNLRDFWVRNLGKSFFLRLLKLVPYTWIVDPTPLPPHAAIPQLDLTDWHQLASLSQRDRSLILKISGYSPRAWGARGVYLGDDLSQTEWAEAVNTAIRDFESSPFILQRYEKPALKDARWCDFDTASTVTMKGRVRLCPYYFVTGDGDNARSQLGGVLATICPADKKIIHGMPEAVLAPCSA